MSGQRLWGWERDRFGTPDRFFALLRDKLLSTLLSGRERRHSNVRQAAVERAPAALGGRSAAIDLQGRALRRRGANPTNDESSVEVTRNGTRFGRAFDRADPPPLHRQRRVHIAPRP